MRLLVHLLLRATPCCPAWFVIYQDNVFALRLSGDALVLCSSDELCAVPLFHRGKTMFEARKMLEALCLVLCCMFGVACTAQATAVPCDDGTVAAAREDVYVLRLAVEGGANSIQGQLARDFAACVARHTGGRCRIEVYLDASLYRDSYARISVGKGRIEMAILPSWIIAEAMPEFYFFHYHSGNGMTLPAFHYLADGHAGRCLNTAIAEQLTAHVLGRWVEIGYAHLFTSTKYVDEWSDLSGMHIHMLAGRVLVDRRAEQLGIITRIGSSENLHPRLHGGKVEGVVHFYHDVEQAGLQDCCVAYVYEASYTLGFLVPLVASEFWSNMDPALQTQLARCWEGLVDAARTRSMELQNAARARLVAAGVQVTQASPPEVARRQWTPMGERRDDAGSWNLPSWKLDFLFGEMRTAGMIFMEVPAN